MKKFILVGMIVFGMLSFAAKITPSNKALEEIMQTQIDVYSTYWIDDNATYLFVIFPNKEKVWVLEQFYADRELAEGEWIGETTNKEIGVTMAYGDYTIHPSDKKGIYYVNDFADLSGRVQKKMYFGFDEKLKTIVIVDKDGNILDKMNKRVVK